MQGSVQTCRLCGWRGAGGRLYHPDRYIVYPVLAADTFFMLISKGLTIKNNEDVSSLLILQTFPVIID